MNSVASTHSSLASIRACKCHFATRWIPSSFANATKPNTASRCGVTSIYPT